MNKQSKISISSDMVISDQFGHHKNVSRIIYGCCIPYLVNAEIGAEEKLERIFNFGINTFDTARIYNKCEDVLGRWLEQYGHRNDTVIISKCCHPNKDGHRLNRNCIIEDLEKSLNCLKTDYIDIYMLHRDSPDCDIADIIETLNELKNQNRILEFGVSNWNTDRIKAANEYAAAHGLDGISVSSPQFSVMEQVHDPWGWNCVSIGGDINKVQRDWYKSSRMPVLAWSGFAGGMASGKIKSYNILSARRKLGAANYRGYASYSNFKRLRRMEQISKRKNVTVSQISLAWLLNQDMNIYPICTTSNEKRIIEIKEALNIKLSQSEIKWIYDV